MTNLINSIKSYLNDNNLPENGIIYVMDNISGKKYLWSDYKDNLLINNKKILNISIVGYNYWWIEFRFNPKEVHYFLNHYRYPINELPYTKIKD